MIYGKQKGGHRAFKRVKIAAKLSKRMSIRTVTPLRDISEKTWVHSYYRTLKDVFASMKTRNNVVVLLPITTEVH